MDYFSAVLMITYSIWGTLLRIMGPFHKQPGLFFFIGLILTSGYLLYVSYMSIILFDYGLTVKISIAMGLFNFILWAVHVARTRRRYQWKLMACLIWTHVALLLELIDIPPYYLIFDSHAIWHAVTIPVGFLWYYYVIDDAAYEVKAQSAYKTV
eukprot:CAMPEP_0117754390 /NCGR_PEP_ID=MMETSP0947-20121206/12803_1 /TAXON_ID=44440 /ORGANISM="Chattonella subsalsa, Strain CCMP2191" /LENGTH=153 /DNA_ID=CAMNT_0005573475 /DNA_START=394 /DNA_END=855 /DNA_ORIENTATION=-